ncbi:MAG: hypothetical protein C5B59_15135 [Bacteroidetes bacterium]|nr:MAG: hypothetical protein C5B59_15135 [Bacteroidota bacterium]
MGPQNLDADMDNHIRQSNFYFLSGLALINTLSITLLLGSFGFFTGSDVSSWQFPTAFLSSLLINLQISRRSIFLDRKPFLISCLVILIVVIISVLVAEFFYDVSFDGQSYHIESVYQLGTKWNPLKTQLPDAINQSQAIYVNHYPKGAEIPQSAIYRITKRIESGKATNFMVLAAGFFLCLSFFFRINRFSLRKKLWLSALFVLNPVTVGELISYYVDGQLAVLVLCFIISAYLIYKENLLAAQILLGSILIIVVNLKFTGVLFACIFSVGFLFLLIVNKRFNYFRRSLATIAAASLIGVLLVGYHPYVINTRDYGSPFYPVTGQSKKDIISLVYPESFKNKNRFEKFFISLFTHTDELKIYEDPDPKISLKIPFTLNKIDVVNAPKLGIKMAGLGPFFSGAIVVSVILLILVFRRKKWRMDGINILILLSTILISIFSVPEAWWARFVPQLWLLPLLIAFLSEEVLIKREVWLKRIIYLSLGMNVALSLINIPWNIMESAEIKYQMAGLKASGDTIRIEMNYFRSNRIRFYENNIPVVEKHLTGSQIDTIVRSSTIYERPENMPAIPKPAILVLKEKLKVK